MYKILHIPTGNFIWVALRKGSEDFNLLNLTIYNWNEVVYGFYLDSLYIKNFIYISVESELYTKNASFLKDLIKTKKFKRFIAMDIYNIDSIDDITNLPSEEEFEVVEDV